MEVRAAVVLAVSGAIVTVWAVRRTQQLADKSERRRMRRDVLRKLVGARHMIAEGATPGPGEFWDALNEVVVTFSDDTDVMKGLNQFHELVGRGFQAEDLNPLLQAMAIAADMGPLNSHLLLRAFAPKRKGQQKP